jgi:hypothetical protein
MQGVLRTLGLVALVLLVPAALHAQQATISGTVKDASGAVFPGVSVEAASPALTEKVRSVVTDGTGQYRIVSLPPGTYSVTVSLQGFNTVKREGIQLSGTLTATIDVDLRVGSLEETVTGSWRVAHRRRAERPSSAGHRRRRPSTDSNLAVVQQRAPVGPRRRRW